MRTACACLFVLCPLLTGCSQKPQEVTTIETPPVIAQPPASATPPVEVPAPKVEYTTPEPEPGFELIFNGHDLTGWQVDGDENAFTVVDGAIKSAAVEGGKQRGWLYTEQIYKNYELRLEFLLEPQADSGVAPRGKYGLHQQLEVQLCDAVAANPDMPLGGLVFSGKDAVPPQRTPTLRPPGEWNDLRIVVQGPVVSVWINGDQLHDQDESKVSLVGIKGDKPWAATNLGHRDGAIGLQVTGRQGAYFRYLRIRPLYLRS